jgi:N-acyl amino acid synthase of PEP-CTERM/exosortase system
MVSENFEVILADDQWSRHIHHQLRYQVFCLETGYEDPAQFPDGEEKDEWDDDAVHFLVQERGSGQWVAAMRLVLPSAQQLPIEKRVPIEASLRQDRRHCAEVSRLCMVGHYRRRLQGRIMPCDSSLSGSNRIASGIQSEAAKQQRTAEILQVLLKAAVTVSCERAIAYCYMLTTRALAKIASYVLPMDMQMAGPACSHRGERYPFLVDVGQVMMGLMEELSQGVPTYRLHSEIAEALPRRVVGGE